MKPFDPLTIVENFDPRDARVDRSLLVLDLTPGETVQLCVMLRRAAATSPHPSERDLAARVETQLIEALAEGCDADGDA